LFTSPLFVNISSIADRVNVEVGGGLRSGIDRNLLFIGSAKAAEPQAGLLGKKSMHTTQEKSIS
jgi:hypothetical protein